MILPGKEGWDCASCSCLLNLPLRGCEVWSYCCCHITTTWKEPEVGANTERWSEGERPTEVTHAAKLIPWIFPFTINTFPVCFKPVWVKFSELQQCLKPYNSPSCSKTMNAQSSACGWLEYLPNFAICHLTLTSHGKYPSHKRVNMDEI